LKNLDAECVFAWCVLPWICLATAVGVVMWLCSLLGGASHLLSIVCCSAVSWIFFRQAKKEPMFTRVLGYCAALFFGFCAVAITGVFNNG